MKNFLFISVLLFTSLLFSQKEGSIKGSVTDKAMNNEPMLFANIQLKGSETNYQTNFNGNFEIENLTPGAHTLIISYAGYESEEITIEIKDNSVSYIQTNLSPMQVNFDDVVGMDTAFKQESSIPLQIENSSGN